MPRIARVLERDMRMWIRDEWKGGIYFVEHALGGTAGISDCFLILPRQMTPCEF